MPALPAIWTTKANEITHNRDVSGTFTASVPLYDGVLKAATLTFTVTAGRALEVVVVSEPGAAGLSGFQAWSTVRS